MLQWLWKNDKKYCKTHINKKAVMKINKNFWSKEKWNSFLPRPGFEPGLLRPQRRVLTTRRSRLSQATYKINLLFANIYPQWKNNAISNEKTSKNVHFSNRYVLLYLATFSNWLPIFRKRMQQQQPMLHLLWFSCRPSLFLLLPNAKPHNQSTKFTGKLIDLCRSRKIAVLSIKK